MAPEKLKSQGLCLFISVIKPEHTGTYQYGREFSLTFQELATAEKHHCAILCCIDNYFKHLKLMPV